MSTLAEKEYAHELIERLAPGQVAAMVHLLEVMVHDDEHEHVTPELVSPEPVSDEDRRRFHQGQAWFAQRGGKGSPMEDMLAEFGPKPRTRRWSAAATTAPAARENTQ